MKRRTIPSTMVAILCLLSGPGLLAPYLSRTNPMAVQSAKQSARVYRIAFELRNETTSHYTVGKVLAVVDGHLAGHVLVFQ